MQIKQIVFILLWLPGVVLPTFSQQNRSTDRDTTKWYNRTYNVWEVIVKSKTSHYSRKNNPAVELMRKVIAAKKKSRLENHDYYQYNKYQKITLAANDIQGPDLEKGIFSKPWMIQQMEVCPYNNKLILPINVNETVTQHVYRKSPHSVKDIIKGERSEGLNHLFQTGEMLDEVMKDFFTDVDIYDDQIRLLQHPFTSPLSKDAINFYRFYIVDTLNVGADRCIQVHFLPNNQQDFGFRGDVYILDDSTYQVKRCELTLPKKSDVNFVDGLKVNQEYTRLNNGEWVLTTDDMVMELTLFDFFSKAIVIRNTRITDHAFDSLPSRLFKGKRNPQLEMEAKNRDQGFWQKYRQVDLTRSEQSMDDFVNGIEQQGHYKLILQGMKLLVENFVETGDRNHPSKVDIGPVNTLVSSNFIDGIRTRLSAQTTANLNSHLFIKGYYAHGWKSHKDYYKGEVIYSFNSKEYLPSEYPLRNITFSSTYDVCSPSDKFLSTDKDNVFTAFKWAKVNKMMFYNRQQLKLEREEEFGLRTTLQLKTEENEACGELHFVPLSQQNSMTAGDPLKIRTTELSLTLRYAPGEKFINTKQHRRPINLDAPVLTLSHTIGFNGFLGGQYRYNFTEASFFKRLWMKSWGKLDVNVAGGIQWNQVPFPLLIMPNTCLSYVIQDRTFCLINNMEFLNDRYASADVTWDLNGKILNRIPLVRRLKWREYIGVKALWGDLSDKNNPYLSGNARSNTLMVFPDGSNIMDPHKGYVELIAGFHNVFRFFHIEYVRRLTYLNLPTATKQGIRVKFSMKF